MRRKNPSNIKKRIVLFSAGGGVLTVIAVLLLSPLGSPLVSAVKNMFFGLNTVSDITYGGKNVQKVVYNGETVWEREPESPIIQETAGSNCPTERTKVRDARDNATYWIRKISNLCWMETNLAYAGGGDNTYGDATTPITKSRTAGYTTAKYDISTGSNKTIEPANPSTSTDGGNTNPQYGYLYNWCAALNSQASACQQATTTQPSQNANGGTPTTQYNICPKGWRLPTGDMTGEYENLNTTINGGIQNNPSGLLTNGLFMYSGNWSNGVFEDQGQSNGTGGYWTSTAQLDGSIYAKMSRFTRSAVRFYGAGDKQNGYAIRCVAD